ncbi:S8 family peptidase [Oceanobacillus limi]|uniref:S8 family peptidase n=1 Tax=Oceanobacillus limi TaxID=930131 RepID=UPI000B88473F|nr:S8 family serine peptidase [Oceanobacillus limi]
MYQHTPESNNDDTNYQNINTTDNTQQDSTNNLIDMENMLRVIILIKKGYHPDSLVEVYGGQVEHLYEEMNMVAAYVPRDKLSEIRLDERVDYLEYDKIVEVKPQQTVEWSNVSVQAPRALQSNLTGRNIKISVIDSGIAEHEDLPIAKGVSMVDYTTSYYDDNGHGTHVAGIIGARNNDVGIVGIAPESVIYAVKVLDQDGLGYTSDVIAGIDWSIQNNVDIINLSLGSEISSRLMESIVTKATDQNILLIAATGNNGTIAGTENNVSYPARLPTVIGVGATDKNNQRASFSSTGEQVELAAPGVNILSTYLNNSYAKMSGTSSASPFVAGIAALLKQRDPNLTISQLRTQLQNASLDLGSPGRDPWYGYGLAQAPLIFKDINRHPATEEILFIQNKGWMIGSNGYFLPEQNLTRVHAALIFVRVFGLEETDDPAVKFADIPTNHEYAREIKIISQHGIMTGSAGRFLPQNNLTREQMVAMLDRAMEIEISQQSNPFEDVSETSWSFDSIMTMYNLGIIKGVAPNRFAPGNPITRAQIARMLFRAAPHIH